MYCIYILTCPGNREYCLRSLRSRGTERPAEVSRDPSRITDLAFILPRLSQQILPTNVTSSCENMDIQYNTRKGFLCLVKFLLHVTVFFLITTWVLLLQKEVKRMYTIHVYCIICILFQLNLAKDHHSINSLPSGIYKIFRKQKYCCKVSLYACKYLYDFNESKKINDI